MNKNHCFIELKGMVQYRGEGTLLTHRPYEVMSDALFSFSRHISNKREISCFPIMQCNEWKFIIIDNILYHLAKVI